MAGGPPLCPGLAACELVSTSFSNFQPYPEHESTTCQSCPTPPRFKLSGTPPPKKKTRQPLTHTTTAC